MKQLRILLLLSLAILIPCFCACPNHLWQQSTIDPNKCYIVVRDWGQWFNAEAQCRSLAPGAHLTSIHSSFENALIFKLVAQAFPGADVSFSLWIGAYDNNRNGSFVYTDGTPLTYTNWMNGQPDLSKQCVAIDFPGFQKWRTDLCTNGHPFICESYTFVPLVPMTTTIPQTTTTACHIEASTMTDCYDWRTIGGMTTDGIYRISPACIDPFDVWCDMTTDGGGWTVFQKRIDNSTVFWTRQWADYKDGFVDGFDKNFWLGLDRIHILSTKDADVTLRIDTFGSRCSNSDLLRASCGPNVNYYGEWASFSVENEYNAYRFHILEMIQGNITNRNDDYLNTSNGMKFTTIDVNNQPFTNMNCAEYRQFGGWWHDMCSNFHLNGKYDPRLGVNSADGFAFIGSLQVYYIHPYGSEMKMRKNR